MPEIFKDVNPPEGFRAYIRRLERASNLHARIAGERTAGALATPERIASDAQAGLGNNTKLRATKRLVIDEETQEIQGFTLDSKRGEFLPDADPVLAAKRSRSARFQAQNSSTKLLFNQVTPRASQWRVTGCSRRKISQNVTVMHSAAIGKAHFGGLMVCGSVWTCPPCAAKVSERRKLEIVAATDMHTSGKGCLYMITFTFSHSRVDVLAPMLKKFALAKQRMRRQRAYQVLKQDMGYVGDIRALEVTWGQSNGFHPHEHDLWLTTGKLTSRKIETLHSELFDLWKKACLAEGLAAPNRQRGINIKKMDSAADYLAKFGREPSWGTSSELTKQHIKQGKKDRYTSFDLLRLYEAGDKRMGALFIEFANAFFGKQQVRWSPGLKAVFGVRQVSDEELAEEQEEDSKMVVEITSAEWAAVLHQPYDVRAQILDLAESGGAEAVSFYLEFLCDREAERLRKRANVWPKNSFVLPGSPAHA